MKFMTFYLLTSDHFQVMCKLLGIHKEEKRSSVKKKKKEKKIILFDLKYGETYFKMRIRLKSFHKISLISQNKVKFKIEIVYADKNLDNLLAS